MMSLSFFSGYEIPLSKAAVPFNPGAVFLTPLGLISHGLWAEPQLWSLYFKESVRGGVFSTPWLAVSIILNTAVAWVGLKAISK